MIYNCIARRPNTVANSSIAGFLEPKPRREGRAEGKLGCRDRDFYLACRRYLACCREPIDVRRLTAIVAASSAPSYYVSFNRVMKVLMRMPYFRRRSCRVWADARPEPVPLRGASGRRYMEIAQRTRHLMDNAPTMPMAQAVAMVLGGGASSFFISGESARRLYSSLCARARQSAARG